MHSQAHEILCLKDGSTKAALYVRYFLRIVSKFLDKEQRGEEIDFGRTSDHISEGKHSVAE